MPYGLLCKEILSNDCRKLPIFKKDDRIYYDNYREISLLNVSSKIFAFLLLSRLMEIWDRMRPNQAGFKQDRG